MKRLIVAGLIPVIIWAMAASASMTSETPQSTLAHDSLDHEQIITEAIRQAKEDRQTQKVKVYHGVLQLLASVDSPNNKDWRIPYWQGVALRHLNQYADAIRKYKQADALNPDNSEILNDWGLAEQNRGDDTIAQSLYEKAIGADPSNARPQNNLGVLLQDQNQYSEAESHLKTAVALDPEWAQSRISLGYCLISLKKYQEALTVAQEAVKLAPNDSRSNGNLGVAYYMLRRYAEAVEPLKYSVLLEPKQDELLDILGYILIETGRPAEAIPYERHAIQLAPHNLQHQHDLALAQDRLHHYDDLLVTSAKARLEWPERGDGYAWTGSAYKGKGQYFRAWFFFRIAVFLDPTDDHVNGCLRETQDICLTRILSWAGILIAMTLIVIRIIRIRRKKRAAPPPLPPFTGDSTPPPIASSS